MGKFCLKFMIIDAMSGQDVICLRIVGVSLYTVLSYLIAYFVVVLICNP